MASVNKVILVGNLGGDPESRNGGAVGISVATSFKPKGGEEKTEWHRVTCFGTTGESVAQFLKKGSKVYLEGRLQTSTYEKNGEKRYSTEIIAERVVFLDKARAPGEDDGAAF